MVVVDCISVALVQGAVKLRYNIFHGTKTIGML